MYILKFLKVKIKLPQIYKKNLKYFNIFLVRNLDNNCPKIGPKITL